jgi:bifunctional DNase/RNase
MVEVTLSRIVIDETSDEQIIVLKEKDGGRSFPIVIGIFEALAIKRVVDDKQISRPLTHELLISVMRTFGAKLTRCLVSDLRDNTYYAILSIESNGKKYEVDARPSDAITLALHEKAAIFVEDSVMDTVAKEEGQLP